MLKILNYNYAVKLRNIYLITKYSKSQQ